MVLRAAALDGVEAGILFAQMLDPGFDLLVRDLGLLLGGLDALVVPDFDFGYDLESGAKPKRLAELRFEITDARIVDRVELAFLQCFVDGFGHEVLNSLFENV